MTTRAPVELVEYRPSLLRELVDMWRGSFEAGVGVLEPHSISEQEEYFIAHVLPCNEVRVAFSGGQLVGFVAASTEAVAQLYVRRGFQRLGVGSEMLNWAKAGSGGSLWLYTFARNHGACAFYEKHGFIAIARGFEPSLELEDIKYYWAEPLTENDRHEQAPSGLRDEPQDVAGCVASGQARRCLTSR